MQTKYILLKDIIKEGMMKIRNNDDHALSVT